MQAQAYTNGAAVGTWPNETSERDATEATNRPTFTATNASYNSKPTVNWGASSAIKLQTATWLVAPVFPVSVVTVGNFGSGGGAMHEGLTTGDRNMLYWDGAEYWIVAGGTIRTVAGGNTSPHLFVAYFDGGSGNETLSVDGAAPIINVDAGSSKATGLTLGNYGGVPNFSMRGQIALMGIYSGAITADSKWADFKSWVTSFYGITVA